MGRQTTRSGVLWMLVFLLAAGTAHGDADARARERARQKRAKARQKNRDQIESLVSRFERDFRKIIDACIESGLTDLGWELVRDLSRRNPEIRSIEAAGAALDRARASKPTVKPDPDTVAKLRKRYQSITKKCGTKMKGYAERLLRKGELELAYRCFLETLRYLPDSDVVRRYVRARFDAKRNRWVPNCVTDGYESNGRVWDRKIGWVFAAHKDKYAAGLYPMVRGGQITEWVKLDDLNRKARKIGTPWTLLTKHFSIRASTDIQNAVAVANWLEEFYPAWIATFSRLFKDKASDHLFGSAKKPRLKVRMFHDGEMWDEWNRSQAGEDDEDYGGNAGYFDPSTKESLFYVGRDVRETARHEMSHQLLDMAIAENSSRLTTSIDEGLAVFVETAHIGNFELVGSGVAVLSSMSGRRDWLMSAKRPPLEKFFNFTYEEFHDSDYRWEHYMLAGLWTAFFFRYQDGKYSDDYVELLQNDSWKEPGSAIRKRFGITAVDIEKEFDKWLRRQLDILGLERGSSVANTYGEALIRGRDFLNVGKILEARVTLRMARDFYHRELDTPSDDTRWRLAASHELLARAYRNAGEGRRAKQSVAVAIPYRKNLPEYGGTTPKKLAACHAFLGLMHAETGWLVSAQEALHESLVVLDAVRKKRPERPDVWYLLPAVHARLAEIYLQQRAEEKSTRHFEAAKAKYREDPDLNAVQAWFLATGPEGHRDVARAVELSREAVSQNEESGWYRLVLGVALLQDRKTKDARDELAASMKWSGGGCALQWAALATAESRLGNAEEAKRWAAHGKKHAEWAALPDWATKSDLVRLQAEWR